MNRTVKALARKVANGTVSMTQAPADMRAFKEAMSLLGWQGVKGGGVLNHASGERVKSWAALAADLLHEADATERAKESEALNLAEAEAARDENEAPGGICATEAEPAAPSVTMIYVTRTDLVPLSDGTAVAGEFTEARALTEGLCESGASLECSLEDPSSGFLRILPESMLPGQTRVQMIQCIPCYEASASAYVRKLHRA